MAADQAVIDHSRLSWTSPAGRGVQSRARGLGIIRHAGCDLSQSLEAGGVCRGAQAYGLLACNSAISSLAANSLKSFLLSSGHTAF
jgi:hypothetical protein